MGTEPSSEPWSRSAIESLVLLNGPMTNEVSAVHMALLELVVRRALMLTAHERRFLFLVVRRSLLLSPGPAATHDLPAPLKVVLERYRSLIPVRPRGRGSGVAVDKVARSILGSDRRPTFIDRLRRREPPERSTFVENVILPHLAQLGLFHWTVIPEGLFRKEGWELTPAGIAELERIRALMADGRESFSRWAGEEPDRAVRFIEQAGAAVLLIPGIAPSIRELNARMTGRISVSSEVTRLTVPWNRSLTLSLPMNAFSVAALAGVFGPGEFDGLDSAYHSLSEATAQAWATVMYARVVIGE